MFSLLLKAFPAVRPVTHLCVFSFCFQANNLLQLEEFDVQVDAASSAVFGSLVGVALTHLLHAPILTFKLKYQMNNPPRSCFLNPVAPISQS